MTLEECFPMRRDICKPQPLARYLRYLTYADGRVEGAKTTRRSAAMETKNIEALGLLEALLGNNKLLPVLLFVTFTVDCQPSANAFTRFF